VLEGQLRVYWGIRSPIIFKQDDEPPSPLKHRHSCAFPDDDIYDPPSPLKNRHNRAISDIDVYDVEQVCK